MTYLFLDTMIYLHYSWFEDVGWQDIIGDQDIQIVVPHITLQELDAHKDNHKSAKVRERARKVATKLLECFLENSGHLKGALSACEFDESAEFDFSQHNLDKSKNDHRLLAAIIEFKKSHSGSVVLITQDVGPLLKANRLDIAAKPLPETYRLPVKEDPLVKENKQLKNELLKIKSAMPILSLGAGEERNKKVELTIFPSTERLIDADVLMARLRDKYPRRGAQPNILRESRASLAQQVTQTGISQVPESEYARYNKERGKYFEQCEAYFLERARRQAQCCAELDLFVYNDGGAPAEDVDLYIHFPDGFELYAMDDLPKEPKEPTPPLEPRNTLEISMSRFNFDQVLIPSQHFPDISNLGLPDPFSIEKTNSYEVRDEFRRIKHGQAGAIRPLMVMFDSYESASSFRITYRISAANLPKPVEGELNVIVKKDKKAVVSPPKSSLRQDGG